MRAWSPILALAILAGCVNAPGPEAEPVLEAAATEEAGIAAANATATEPVPPLTLEGTVWLPPSSGQERAETLIEVPVAAPGSRLLATLHLGSRYGGADLPPLLTDVAVELRDPAGEALGSASLKQGSADGRIEAVAATEGAHVLAILSYGGSDEQANGDHLDYVVEVTPP